MSTKELKIQCKELARQIIQNKIECKSFQREHNGYDGGHYFAIHKLQHDYRHKHIAYCQLRGRKYEEIERRCSDDHQPDFILIKEIMDEHNFKAVEDVRACA